MIRLFFATPIPSQSGIFFTDRKRYQRLTRPGTDQEVELALLRIMGKYSKDNSYKNVDPKDIKTLISKEVPVIAIMGLFKMQCFQLERKGSFDEEILRAYNELAQNMSKQVVNSFNKEITKFREQLKLE